MGLVQDAVSRRSYVINKIIPSLDKRPFINGEFVDSIGIGKIKVFDPMTEKVLTEMPLALLHDIESAVSAARAAFDFGPWPRLHPRERAAILLKLAALIERDTEDLALLESTDTGKRIAGIRSWDIPNAAEVYRYYAGWADKISGDVLADIGSVSVYTRREPVGVCAAIIPWNFPFPCIAWKIAPALATGCTVVVKPPERAPLSAQALANLVQEAGFPPGVVNIVMGQGEVAGAALIADPRVDKITFTGDTITAQSIVRSSAAHLPRLTMELGGKSPNVILPDADLDAAVTGAIDAMFSVQGQNCCAGSRTFIHEQIFDEFTEKISAALANRRLGDPLNDDTEQGPQIDHSHFKRIDSYVKEAVSDGAICVTGGRQASIGGLFYEPTILSNAQHDMRVVREEIFGPVGCIFPFSNFDQAIEMANDTKFGLAAAIWTKTDSLAERFIRECRVGTCWVNCYGYFDTVAPWGGMKLSGRGRELGRDGVDAFLETKTVFRSR
jgi:aldehyde dehydrogenase (NAD+)